MAQYRKKPVVIEAVQWFGQNLEGVCELSECGPKSPECHVHTLEGFHIISHSDWLITGIKGEKYPCRADIFEATYEKV